MRVSTSQGALRFVPGRAEEGGSHRQMSRSMLPSLPARAGLRNPGQSGSCPGFCRGGSGKTGWEQVRKSCTMVSTGPQSP